VGVGWGVKVTVGEGLEVGEGESVAVEVSVGVALGVFVGSGWKGVGEWAGWVGTPGTLAVRGGAQPESNNASRISRGFTFMSRFYWKTTCFGYFDAMIIMLPNFPYTVWLQ
jgi:hypothetical protein